MHIIIFSVYSNALMESLSADFDASNPTHLSSYFDASNPTHLSSCLMTCAGGDGRAPVDFSPTKNV